jgi:hypothetical protein
LKLYDAIAGHVDFKDVDIGDVGMLQQRAEYIHDDDDDDDIHTLTS